MKQIIQQQGESKHQTLWFVAKSILKSDKKKSTECVLNGFNEEKKTKIP